MGSDDKKVLTLKHKIKKTECTSEGCMGLLLIDKGTGGAGGKRLLLALTQTWLCRMALFCQELVLYYFV
jgi:hypothetical protein